MTLERSAAFVAAWMAGSLVVGLLLATVAWLLHRLVRELLPARLVWSVALFGALFVALTLPIGGRAPDTTRVVAVTPVAPSPLPVAEPTHWERVRLTAQRVTSGADALFTKGTASAAYAVRGAPAAVHVSLVLLWPVASLVLLTIAVAGYRRQLRTAARGETVQVLGTNVTVTESLGPAVLGVSAPRIVLPRWMLQRSTDELQLVIRHERSHIAAHDPLLLLAACGAVVCMPWNGALWFMLSRLRLAIELDCDRRVLAEGTARRTYGELLVNLSARAHETTELSPVPAFSHRASHLERRLRTMTDRPTTHRLSRLTTATALAATALVAACGTELPTSTEVANMDAAAAERALVKAAPGGTIRQYQVNGKPVSAAEASAIPVTQIASIDVQRVNRTESIMNIRTTTALDSAVRPASMATDIRGTMNGDSISADTAVVRVVALRKDGTGDSLRTRELRGNLRVAPFTSGSDLMILIDGAKSEQKEMDRLDPSRIASIEIIKGPAAEQLYGAAASKGVIKITTKK